MAVQSPTRDQILDLASELGLDLSDEDVDSYIGLFQGNVEAYNLVDSMPDNLPEVKYPRTPGYKPRDDENKYNAWHVKTEIKGASRGKLKGREVVLKDNIIFYYCTNYRSAKNELGLKWNDKKLKIKWPIKKPILSKKDKKNISFLDYVKSHA